MSPAPPTRMCANCLADRGTVGFDTGLCTSCALAEILSPSQLKREAHAAAADEQLESEDPGVTRSASPAGDQPTELPPTHPALHATPGDGK